jgi:hypothetical protein
MTDRDRPMPANPPPPSPESPRASLSDAHDRIRLNHWMPPQQGIFPRIRIGPRWFNTLWTLPIGAAAKEHIEIRPDRAPHVGREEIDSVERGGGGSRCQSRWRLARRNSIGPRAKRHPDAGQY